MPIKSIRLQTGLTQREFAGKYHIPLQTLKQWESSRGSSSHRTPPDYVVHMIGRLAVQDFHCMLNTPLLSGQESPSTGSNGTDSGRGIGKDQETGHR